jgi:hypothetical protein
MRGFICQSYFAQLPNSGRMKSVKIENRFYDMNRNHTVKLDHKDNLFLRKSAH